MNHRVAVTGMGLVTPVGTGIDAFWAGVLGGRVAVAPISRFDAAPFACRIAAEVRDFDPLDYMEARAARRRDRFAQFAVSAAHMALQDAAFPPAAGRDDVGVFIGSALGGVAYGEEQHDRFLSGGLTTVKPLLAISVFGGASVTNIALEFGLRGPVVANGNSCAAGAVAIGDAFRAVARGDVRAALAGGVEAPLSPLAFGAFALIRAMSTRNDDPERASRPFDRDRDGFVMAEGAGVLLVERMHDAVMRGARIYGEIVGYGLTNDAYHMTAPRPDGAGVARAMQAALIEARLGTDEVELIDAHGSATPLNDRTETLAIKQVLGTSSPSVPVAATKGQHAHALGATGAWEAALSLLVLRDGTVPRVVNLERSDPACDLQYVREAVRRAPRNVVSLSSGFGGINAALVFRHAA